jgi:CHAT domain-containing protein/tetratricopeptide (TPR) repeat protein
MSKHFISRWKKSLLYLGLVALSFTLVTAASPVAAVVPVALPQATYSSSSLGQSAIEAAPNAASLLDRVDRGRSLYTSGRLSEAVAVWQQTAQAYQAEGDPLNQALSLSYLATAYQDLGDRTAAETAITQGRSLVQALVQPNGNPEPQALAILAKILNTQGSLELAIGQPRAALDTWRQAAETYAQIQDESGQLGSQINQAQALQTLGLYRQAQTLLKQVARSLQAQPDSALKVTGLQSVGMVFQVVGDLSQSQQVLEQGLAIAQQLQLPLPASATLLSLGNTYRALDKPEAAMEAYQQAAQLAPSAIAKLDAQLNQLSLQIELGQQDSAQSLLPQIQAELVQLAPSRQAIYARVNLAESWTKLQQRSADQQRSIAQMLAEAMQQAKDLQDARAESVARGQLGKLYEQTQQWTEAQSLTEKALLLAQSANADDITYRWQWQLGRILKQKVSTGNLAGNQAGNQAAIAAYTEAVKTLKSIRADLLATNPTVQFSFRDSVEPVYRELVELLVQSAQPSQSTLRQARELIEDLQLAELENFFRSACLDSQPAQIDSVDPSAAVIYPIILSDRLAVIVALPDQTLHYYATALPRTEVETVLENLLESLNPAYSDPERLRLSQQVYRWLVQPAEPLLTQSRIKTLVFVLDGTLRNLPMAALYDGKSYLVEKYGVALTPGLQLLGPIKPLAFQGTEVLLGGITEARQGFAALPGVQQELAEIAGEAASETLLNQTFTLTNLQKQINSTSIPVVHLATHGQFSSNLQETFILTWDNRLNPQDFKSLFGDRLQNEQNPIELLVLSACQTAEGDKRAALGVAGMAVRSGARSTLATLWAVQDQSTAEFMIAFYKTLAKPGVTKAESMRQAQLTLLQNPDYNHPFYWAPFVLIGNWL